MADIKDQLIKDSYNYVLQSDLSTGVVYRIGGSIPVNPKFLSGLTINSGFTYSNGTEQNGYALLTDGTGYAYWGPVSAATPSSGVTSITVGEGLSANTSTGNVTIVFTGSTGITGEYLPLSGGTVTGLTFFNSGVDINSLTAFTAIFDNITVNTQADLNGLDVQGLAYFANDVKLYTDLEVDGNAYIGTVSATTYLNYPDSYVTGFSLSSNTITLRQNRPDQYSAFTISLSAYTDISGDYLPLSGGTVYGNTTFTSGLTVNYIDFDTTPNVPAPTGGTVYFDSTENALSYKPITPSNDVTVNLGQESLIRLYNNLGYQINNGQALHITGATSGAPTVSLAVGTGGDAVQFQISGIATHDIPNLSYGFMTVFGVVRDVNLTGFTVGEQVYLSQTVPGAFASYSELSFTGRTCEVGHVLDNSSSGKLQVTILNEIEGTIITTQENNILAANNSSTGVFQFSGLSITTPSGTTFNVGAVEGWIIDNVTAPANPTIQLIIYPGSTGNTALYVSSATETYILLTSGLTLIQQTTFPTPQQRRQNLYLGKFGHGNRQFLINAFNEPDSALSPVSQLRDMFTAVKLINDGVIASPNAANLNINTSAGVLYGLGIGYVTNKLNPNSLTINSQSPATFQYRTQTGGTAVNTTLIEPGFYDLNGVIEPITGTKATNQRIYLLQNGQIRIQYGQEPYNQLAAAVAALQNETFVTFPNFRDNGILIGVLSILSSCDDLTDTSKAQFFSVSKFGELIGAAGGTSTTTLQQAYDNSGDPEIVINATLDGLSIKNGTTNPDNTTQLLQGLNSGGTVTSFIRADGAISGSTIFGNGSGLTHVFKSVQINGTPQFSANTNTFINFSGINLTITSGANNTLIFSAGTGGNSSGTTEDTFVTGFSLNNNIITLSQNRVDQYSAFTISLSAYTGGTGSTVVVSGDYLPLSGGTVTGATNFTAGLNVTGNTILSGLTTVYGVIPVSAAIKPGVNNSYDLGEPSFRWREIYTTNIDATNTITTPYLYANTIFTTTISATTYYNLPQIVINNTLTVALTGSTDTNVDFNSIKNAVNSITGATSANTYTVSVAGGLYNEDPFTIPSWVSVVGESSISTVIQANDPSQTLIRLSDQSAIFDCQIQGCTGTGVSAVLYSSSTTPQSSAISYVENVRFGANYTHAKVVAYGNANIIMQCSNVKYGGYPFTIGFYATNNTDGIGRMQLRNVTSTNGGIVTTSGLIFAKADAASCGFIVNGCLLTKAVGAAAGTGFYVENGGFLRLTAVNFQRWAVGIDAPQIGSAPSIDAIALNFENNTIDVNIAHSGATGKIQGTDNFLKTIINQNAPLYEVNQDPKEITVAKKGGDFTSIKSAVDYLISSGNTSSTNRYVISVGPGEFAEDEIDLTNTPYVSIVGSNIQTTLIKPTGSTQNIISIGVNNEVSFLTLSGAPSGYSALYCYDIGDFAQAHKVSFYDCHTNVWVESSTQDTKFFGEYLDFNGDYTYGTKVIGNNGYLALANMENYYNFPTGAGITYCNYATGSGATISVFVGDNVSNGVSGTTAFYIQDNASLNASTITSDGCTYGIRNPNIGGSVTFDVDNASFVNGQWDLYVESVNTFGTFAGSSSHQKLFTQSSDIYWSILDIDDGEFDITRKASVTFADGTHTDFTTLIFEGGSMGVMSGGTLTEGTGTTVNVATGFGYLEKSSNNGVVQRIDWSSSTISLSANTDTYIYFNENEILSSSGTRPDSQYNITLGRVVTDSSSIIIIDQSPFNASHTSNRFGNLFREALGPIYADGSITTEGVTPFTLNVTQGEYYYSTNEFNPIGGTGITFTQYYRAGTGSTWVTTATTLVNNTQYDNNGTLTGLTASAYTKHTLYVVGDGVDEQFMLVIGQDEYSTLVEAENALLPLPPSYFIDSVSQVASIYIRQGNSNIIEIEDIRPTIGFRAGGVNASSVHGNLLGLTADDHLQYLLVDGGRAMAGNLNMGSNNITNAGTINGVTIQTHATRHQFGGADPVGTVTPTANAIPYADVNGKLDGWISPTTITGGTNIQIVGSWPSFGINFTGTTGSSFTGGTVSGATIFTNGLTANTISATTYQNLPVSGLTEGENISITGSNGNFTISFTGTTGSNFTGGTVSGATIFTDGLTANTISATTYYNLPVSAVTNGDGISASTSGGVVTITNTRPQGITGVTATDGLSGDTTNFATIIINTDKGSSQNIFKNIQIGGITQFGANSNNSNLNFSGVGITITSASTNTLVFTNAGVTSITTGYGLSADTSTGNITIVQVFDYGKSYTTGNNLNYL